MLTNEQEKVQYLANVLSVALIDGSLSIGETTALEEIRKGIDAKKNALANAHKMVEAGSYSFVEVGSFSDKIKNLEDMLFVVLIDTDLNESRSRIVNEFCRRIHVTQEQYENIFQDVSSRCDSFGHDVPCPSCSKPNPLKARFCSSCGQPLSITKEASHAQTEFDIPKTGYAVEFCESTAGGFHKALEIARATGTMQTTVRNKKSWYLAFFPRDRFTEVLSLASALTGVRNRKVYLDGQEIDWNGVFGFMWCASRRDTAYRPVEYCFGKDENRINPWGCK